MQVKNMSNYNNGSSRRRTTNTGGSRRSGEGTRSRSSGTRSHSSYSSAASGHSSGGGHHRKKKNNPDITQILMYVIGAIVLILVIALAVKGCGKLVGDKKESTEASETETSEESSGVQMTIDGVAVDGMTQAQARAAVLAQYDWDMKVTYEDKEASVGNIMEENLDELLDEIYAGTVKPEAYTVKTDNLLELAKAEAALVSGQWNMVAKNGGISGYDKESGKFTFSQGSNGMVIDQDKLAEDIVAAVQKKDYKAVLKAQVKEVRPDMTADQLKEKYKTIGTYTTKTTSNKDRNENIRLACAAINGIIINPGQEFSFNNTTGARSLEKGYKPATAYSNGEIVQEPGGGVCQVSSTLYNAVIFSGLKSTERHPHSYEPSYVTPGEDAMVSFGGPDFKFVNNSDYPVAIKISFADQVLTTSIYGVPILKEGTKIRMTSEKTGAIDPPEPVYEEDQTLQLDETKTTKEAVPGSRWLTYLVTYENDKEVSREFFHSSNYRGKSAIIKRNTSGVVVTTEASTEATAEMPSTEAVSAPSEQPAGPAGDGPGGETKATQPSGEQVSPGGTVAETNPVVVSPGGTQAEPNQPDAGGQGPAAEGPVSPAGN